MPQVGNAPRDGPPAVVLGSGLTVLGAARCLARAGIEVVVATEQPAFVAASRWCRSPSPPGTLDDPERLPAYLDRLAVQGKDPDAPGAVLLPCSDEWVHRVARLPPTLRRRFPASVPPDSVLEVLTNKRRFAEHLATHELPHPRTWPADGPEDLAAARREADTRLFLKPRHSLPFFRRFGIKAVMPDDPEHMRRAVERFGEEGHALLVQEYVPGPSSNHYFVDGFVDAEGSVRGLLVRRRLRMYPRHFGNSSYMVSVPPDEAADAVEVTRTLLEGLGYRGIFSAEFKRDERDGTCRILEVNARPWIFVEFAARCGMDVCTMAYQDALGRPVPSVDRYRTGRTLVQPYYDAQACLGAYREGELRLVRILRSWLGADLPTFAWDDPMPALRELMAWIGRFTRQRLAPGATRDGT